jgi:hypothetical protein
MSILRENGNSIIDPDGYLGGNGARILLELPCDSFRQRLSAGPFGLMKKDCEFIPADPARYVRRANDLETCPRHASQDFISRCVPISIVDSLKFAEIERKQCK